MQDGLRLRSEFAELMGKPHAGSHLTTAGRLLRRCKDEIKRQAPAMNWQRSRNHCSVLSERQDAIRMSNVGNASASKQLPHF
jgi:hypothetical protein